MSAPDLAELLEAVLVRAGQLLGTEHGYLAFPDDDGQAITVRYGIGVMKPYVGYRMAPGEGVAGRVWQTGEPLAVTDYTRWSGRSPGVRPEYHALAAAALRGDTG